MTTQEPKIIDRNALSLDHVKPGGYLSASGPQLATTYYAGLFEAGSGGYYLWNTPSWDDFAQKSSDLATQGLRLISIDTDEEDPATTWYLGAWVGMQGGYSLWRTSDWTSFYQQFQNNSQNMRLVDIDIHPSGGTRWYTGTWADSPVAQKIVHDLGWDDFVAEWKQLSNSGYRLTKVQAFPSAGLWKMTGLYEAGSGEYALLMTSKWQEFFTYYQSQDAHMQLVDFEVYDDNETRWYIGVWRETRQQHKFIYGQDWGSFVNQWTQLSKEGFRLRKAIRYSSAVEVPEPEWQQIFQKVIGGTAEGYAYKVMKGGAVVAQGVHYARSASDPPQTTWTADTRISLASVSKAITAVAVLKLLGEKGLSINDKFYPIVQSQFPQHGSGVDTVTIKDLLTMKSGMVSDGTLNPPDLWVFLKQYLTQGLVATPGQTYAYSNTNFTILQAIIDVLTGHGGVMPDYYETYVRDKVLVPMGINPQVFSATPDPQTTATLTYSNSSDSRHGQYWGRLNCVAAGGWIASANELSRFLAGVRNHTVLSPESTVMMLNEYLGWYPYDGIYGRYFHHNGGLGNGATPPQGLATGIIHLADGYDALLLINSLGADTIGLMVEAFETRNIPAAVAA
jgi:CubicO group peptidase (beta-lactamase class C family)